MSSINEINGFNQWDDRAEKYCGIFGVTFLMPFCDEGIPKAVAERRNFVAVAESHLDVQVKIVRNDKVIK